MGNRNAAGKRGGGGKSHGTAYHSKGAKRWRSLSPFQKKKELSAMFRKKK